MATHIERERLERILRGQVTVMEEVHELLYHEQKQDDLLRAMVLSSRDERPTRILGMDPDRVYHRDSIRDLCVRYRLRFLPGRLFKGALPNQALYALRRLERKCETPMTSFMIVAPSTRFKLCDSEVDPLLFVPLGDDRYYLVHRWGADLSVFRSIVNWPLRTALHLSVLILLFAAIVTLVIPTGLLNNDPSAAYWGGYRYFFFFWSSMVCASFTVFGWFAFFGQFSTDAWNSRYFN